MTNDLQSLAKQFINTDLFLKADPYGEGHINDTYAVTFQKSDGTVYRTLMQRINHTVFADPAALMSNIHGVTEFLKNKICVAHGDAIRESMTIIPTQGGSLFYQDEKGEYWRMYIFIENATTYQSCRNEQDFYNCGFAFGKFQRLLSDYPIAELTESIPDFHNTVKRFAALQEAIRQNKAGRVSLVQPEIDFALKREKDAGEIIDLLNKGMMPYRVTHNDTKLNNIMIDDTTGEAICVIDLDTVMQGAACYDFGDSIRFGASTAAEDETDLGKVSLDLHLFGVFTKGYLKVAKEFLTETELYSLAIGAKIMTFECGIRFLTDYLNGDTYFKIHREHHNLDRCHTQFKLVVDMEQKMQQMQDIVHRYCTK
ncbi:MAG: phosphotransferase [Bacteroidaceae bacterium]|nr:aminoglycoside phosphotransferase family protein [Bacteroidaceae bacterium]